MADETGVARRLAACPDCGIAWERIGPDGCYCRRCDRNFSREEIRQPAAESPTGLPNDIAVNRPLINVSRRHLYEIAEDAWNALLGSNRPPWLFRHAGQMAEIGRDDEERPLIAHLSLPALRGRLDRVATWQKEERGGGIVPARPPKDVVEDLLALDKPLPVLRGITGTPVFTADGKLVTARGYQARTGLYYQPVGEKLPDVPERPTAQDVERAKRLLLDEWLDDFLFVDDSSRAHAVAAALTPTLREMISGPTPLFAVDAPTPGSGKGLLADGIGIVTYGAVPGVMTEARGEEEQRKRITAALRDGMPVILLDNIKRRLESAPLSAVLTTTEWADRLLGRSETVRLPNRSLWLATGNNLQLDAEMTRRVVWIRLDPRVDRPWERTGFQHEPLIPWMQDHRHELVWALLVLVRHWIAQGRHAWQAPPLGSFESWCRVAGGVLEAAGIVGFLDNREELYRRVDAETEEWRTFVRAWWERFTSDPVKASDLLSLVMEHELLASVFVTARDNATERSLSTRLGVALAQRRDRRFGEFFLKHIGDDGHRKGALYMLEPAEPAGNCAEPPRSEEEGSAEVPQDNSSPPDTTAEGAEPAEPVFNAKQESGLVGREDEIEEEIATDVPHLPHVPQSGSDDAVFAAEPWRNLAPSSSMVPQDPHRCPGCRKPMSVVRLNDVCGTCQAWGIVPREMVLNGRRG